jgi:hypothetical protein
MDNQTREYAQQNLTLPHDVVPLPSGGLFYKNKKQSIKVGYLTAMDENIILGSNNDIATTLLRHKIYEPDFKVDDMLEGDVEAVLIFLRNTSFGPEIDINVVDPATKNTFKTTVRIDQLSIIKGQDPNPDGTFSLTLPTSGAEIKLKLLTIGEVNEIDKIISSYPKGRIAPVVTLKLQRQIVELNGSTDLGEIAKFVEQMPISDSKHIKKFLKSNEPRLDMSKEVIAPSGEKLTVNVGFGVDFFRPFF